MSGMAGALRLRVNGHERVVVASSHHTLLEVLRRELHLAGVVVRRALTAAAERAGGSS
jgi:aerobic-type carbon monoxide dehydrogenase small subunit (CoxS/CutS family)